MSIANDNLTPADFGPFFRELWGYEPYDWQQRMAEQVMHSAGNLWPEAIALPTAAGKTACLDIAVFALAALADTERATSPHPRRLFYTVDRRNIVDQTYDRAERLAGKLAASDEGIVKVVADRLRILAGGSDADDAEPLAVYRLRGGIRQSSSWERNPRQPAIITTTVDQVGSALLFRAYGKGRGVWPVHAGLAANDSLIILDEAHCAQPFLQTIRAVRKYRQWAECPTGAPFQAVIMSATPPGEITESRHFRDTSSQPADSNHPLGRRQLAAKPATLAVAKRVPRSGDVHAALGRELAGAALDLTGQGIPTAVVFANRVATAREAYRIIRERDIADTVLLTGRMRQREREHVMHTLARVSPYAAPQTRAGARPLIAVATQTLEIGADLDFDGLVTECASLDALRQRFGRLNRTGRALTAPGRIIIRADQVNTKTPDPIYGDAISATWQWLNEQAGTLSEINFGIANIAELLADTPPDDRAWLNPPAENATVMLPAHIDAWAQTSPGMGPSPSPDSYLHGKANSPADVQVCWRAGLNLDNLNLGDDDAINAVLDLLRPCPPSARETLPVPLFAFRKWLADNTGDDSGDAPGVAESEPPDAPGDDRQGRRVVRWPSEPDDRNRITHRPAHIRPGDTIIIPTRHRGNFHRLGDMLEYDHPAALDIGDVSNRAARGQLTLHISNEALAGWTNHPGNPDGATTDEPAPTVQKVGAMLDEIRNAETAAAAAMAVNDMLELLAGARLPGWLGHWGDHAQELLDHPAGFVTAGQSDDNLVIQARRPRRDTASPREITDDTDDVAHSRRARRVTLTDHSHGVAGYAARYAAGCGLAGKEYEALHKAALLHDIGKADPLFQQAMHGGSPYYDTTQPLAKSPNAANIRVRHELMSVRMAESNPALLPDDPDARDLALHLIASHHGHCRPFAPFRRADLEKRAAEFILDGVAMRGQGPTELERLDSGVTERYWRLTRKYGWWGLAYLEAMLRVADWSRSQWEETHDD